jgi:hypothetical protein
VENRVSPDVQIEFKGIYRGTGVSKHIHDLSVGDPFEKI